MKKTLITTVFSLSILVGCSNIEAEKENNFKDVWELDLSGLKLDLTKPYVENYSSETQRNAIISQLSDELFQSDENFVGNEESQIVAFSFDFSAEAKTITTHLIAKEQDFVKSDWILLSACKDANSLNTKIIKTVAENPSVAFVVTKDLYSKDVQLFYNVK